MCLGALEVLVDAVDGDEHVLVDAVGRRHSERTAGAADDDVAGSDLQLRVIDHPVAAGGTQPLTKAERLTEPRDGCRDVRIDEDGHHCRARSGLIRDHDGLLLASFCARLSAAFPLTDCRKLTLESRDGNGACGYGRLPSAPSAA